MGEAPRIDRLPGADLMGMHVRVGVDGGARVGARRLVRQGGPQGPGHFARGIVFLPHRANSGIGLRLLEAFEMHRVLAVQVLLYRLGDRIARTHSARGFDVQREFVPERFAEAKPAGELHELVHGQAGADDRAMVLAFQFPQFFAPSRRRRLLRRGHRDCARRLGLVRPEHAVQHALQGDHLFHAQLFRAWWASLMLI